MPKLKQTKTKRLTPSQSARRQQLAAGALFIGLTILGGGAFAIDRAYNTQDQRLQSFNETTITIQPEKPLKVEFLETGVEQTADLKLKLGNTSLYDYLIQLDGNIEDTQTDLDQPVEFNITAGEQQEVTFALPLLLENGASAEQQLAINLTTKEQNSGLLPAHQKSINYKLPVDLVLLQDNQIASSSITAEQAKVTYTPANPPTLKYSVLVKNLNSHDVESGYFEVTLIDDAGKHVQPVAVEELPLKAKQEVKRDLSFKFSLPPADMLKPGAKNYKLRLTYLGQIGARKFQTQADSQAFNIQVNAI